MSRRNVLDSVMPKGSAVKKEQRDDDTVASAQVPPVPAKERAGSSDLEASNRDVNIAPSTRSATPSGKERTEGTTRPGEAASKKRAQTQGSLEAPNTPAVGQSSGAVTEGTIRGSDVGESAGLEQASDDTSARGEFRSDRAASDPPPPLENSVLRNRSGALKAMDRVMGLYAAAEAEGEFIVSEIEPDLIERSFIGDRIEDQGDSSIKDLIESIRENGQQVPILVRAHPDKSGRYQTAYGHRRVRAAVELGRPVRAVVRQLSDEQLVVAQGQENLERRDLSYIERAFFALRLKERDFTHAVISAAMGVYKPDVSNFIKVAKEVPGHVVRAIGPAPKAGGPRWRLLAERIKAASNDAVVRAIIEDPSFMGRPTDERFVVLLDGLAPKAVGAAPAREFFKDAVDRKVGRIEETDDRFTISIDCRVEPGFGAYLRDQLPTLLEAFRRARSQPSLQPELKGDETPE